MPPFAHPYDAEAAAAKSEAERDLARRAAAAAQTLDQGGPGTETLRSRLLASGQIPREPAAVRVIRAAVRTLPEAVHDAELRDPGEFRALFQLMLGMGIDPEALSERLEVGVATIARYASGASAPATVHARRGALIETARILEESMRTGNLACLAHMRN